MAGGAVRELITKIKFVLDKASESKANQTIQKLKTNLGNVGNKTVSPKVDTHSISNASTAVGRLRQRLSDLSNLRTSVNIKPPKGSSGFADELGGRIGIPTGMSVGVMAGAGVAAGFAAIGSAVTGAVKTFAEFDATMSRVKALTGATNGQMEILTDTARKLGATTKFSATEAAEAMTYLGMAGWNAENIVKAMPGLLDLAAASGADLARVADIVSDDLTAFKMSADQAGHFADVLAVASSKANTDVSMMGETFKYVGPLAGAFGFSIEDMALATGLMANSSIKGEQAGTTLRALLTRLVKPTKESAEAMGRLGLEVTDANGKMKPFRQILKDMREGFARLGEAEKGEVAAMLAGQEAMSGTLALANEKQDVVDGLADSLDNAAGAAHNTALIMNDNLLGAMKELSSQASETAMVFGGFLEPKVREAVKGIKAALHDATDYITPFFELMAGPKGDSMASLNRFNELQAQHPTMTKFVEFFQVIGDNIEKAGTAVDWFGQKLSSAFGNETVNSGIQKVIDAFVAIEKFRGESMGETGLFGGTGLGMFSHLVVKAVEAGAKIVEAIMEALGDLVVKGTESLGGLAEAIAKTADSLIRGFGEAIGQVKCFFKDLGDYAIGIIESISMGLVNIEVMSDRVRIRLGENARAYSAMTNNSNVDVTNNVTVNSASEAATYTSESVAGFSRY